MLPHWALAFTKFATCHLQKKGANRESPRPPITFWIAILESQVQRHLHNAWTADCVLNGAESSASLRAVGKESRRIVEAVVEGDVVLGSIEAGCVGQIEHLEGVFKFHALVDGDHFGNGEIRPLLEWTAEEITSVVAEGGFKVVSGWNAVLPRLQELRLECVRIQATVTVSRRLAREARREWDNGIGDEVVAPVKNAAYGTAEVDHAIGLAALERGQSGDAPSIERLVGETVEVGNFRNFVNVVDGEDVRSVEIGIGVILTQVKSVVAVEEEPQRAPLIQRVRPCV